jgi:hypothetical protein
MGSKRDDRDVTPPWIGIRCAAILTLLVCPAFVCLLGQSPEAAPNHAETRACSLLDRNRSDPKHLSTADLFRAYSTQVHLIRSIHLIGHLSGKAAVEFHARDKPLELAAIIDLVQPDLIRVTGIVPFQGNRAVELTSDGHKFGLLIPESGKMVFLTGPIDAPARSSISRENLRPRPFIEALRWEEGAPSATAERDRSNDSLTRTLTIDVAQTEDTPSRTVDIQFDVVKGVVDLVRAYDSKGSAIFEAHYSDWRTQTREDSGVPVECFARRIILVELQQGYRIDLRIDDLTLNPAIPKSKFRPVPPRGIPIKQLTLTGGRGDQ